MNPCLWQTLLVSKIPASTAETSARFLQNPGGSARRLALPSRIAAETGRANRLGEPKMNAAVVLQEPRVFFICILPHIALLASKKIFNHWHPMENWGMYFFKKELL
ncbi:MAG: hypothetical protein LC725_03265 [Lentisphaerae bacterium]|nr:hypothetical protein [Lentisphaerota bacterium]